MAPIRSNYTLAGNLELAAPTPFASRLDPSVSVRDNFRNPGMAGICLNPNDPQLARKGPSVPGGPSS